MFIKVKSYTRYTKESNQQYEVYNDLINGFIANFEHIQILNQNFPYIANLGFLA